MYYIIDGDIATEGYCFLFNDMDKSVRLTPSSVDILGTRGTIEDIKCNYSKYRLLFNTASEYMLKYTVYEYRVGDADITLSIVMQKNVAIITLYFVKGYTFTRALKICGFVNFSYKTMSMHIPFRMVDYILDLKSRRNFDGIMDAFDGLISEKLSGLVPEIYGFDVQLINWGR